MLCLILSFNVCVVGRNEVVLRVYGSTLWTQVDGVRERWREDIQPLQCGVTLYLCVCVFRRLSVTIDAYCIFLTKCFFKFYDLSFICEVTKKHNKTIGTIVIGTDDLLLGCIFLVCNNCIKPVTHWRHILHLWCFSKACIRLPPSVVVCFGGSPLVVKCCSIWLRSGDWLGQSTIFQLYPLMKSFAVLAVHFASLYFCVMKFLLTE